MRFDPAGKVAVVTGASSGIGAATTRRLAAAGMTVVAVARREDRLVELAAGRASIRPYVADVRSTAQMDALAAWVDAEYGACHVLVNNAGIGGGTFDGRDDLDDALATLDVNLSGPIRGMAAFAALLERSAPARVINVASVAGKLGIGPAAYAASKFALVGFSEATALSWAHRGITVCQLNPGFIETEGFTQAQIKRSPMGRLVGQPELVAVAIHDAIVRGSTERTVPRWYRAFVVLRHVAAPLYRAVASRMARAGGSRT
ncbi:MAG: SDR family NAD(P)-dependent oxidoreductase [Nitriliruptoraceae bacterium]|nr:SDR family NAD(P)-dependent oxidoreductase [Nitriliruptoraceae bacterium]